jgi:hypothetical protein
LNAKQEVIEINLTIGFEWFGSGDGLESLTAFGIMQFVEMKEIIDVDDEMLSRTMLMKQKFKNLENG